MSIFTKIINNEIPSYKIYEDEDTIAILDISQMTYGHTLVIPKKEYKNIFDIEEETLVKLIKVVNKIAKHYNTFVEGVNIFNNSGSVAGQEVEHFHFHIIPRYKKDEIEIKHNKNEFDLKEIYNKFKL